MVKNVLILCTGNSARSILGEALITHLGAGRFKGFSAGSKPTGRVNPFALETLARHGISLPDARSKTWDEFAQAGAPAMDFVFTVCDSAAAEECPYFPGDGVRAHWGIADPAGVQGSDDEKRAAFELAYQRLHRKVAAFVALDFQRLDASALSKALAEIGKLA
ncbi:MAG: arsenate reductase ArsC [Burkholderiaceae bacterium]